MASSQLAEPIMDRSGLSVHSREEDEYTEQTEENPLDVRSDGSVQPTPTQLSADNPFEGLPLTTLAEAHHLDEPPPPYQEKEQPADAPQIAPVEYSCENSPQLLVTSHLDTPVPLEPPPRNPRRLLSSLPEVSPVQSPGSPAFADSDSALVPAPLNIRPVSSIASTLRGDVTSIASESTLLSGKSLEAGFDIHPAFRRPESTSSLPSITVLSPTEPLRHAREPGKLIAYLVPFPKPRLRGIREEDVPERFLVYTPLPAPLSKPGPGEKESHWHKTKRTWQEDVRKAEATNASRVSWSGVKAKSTILIGKGVDLTRSSNVMFLDRAAEGSIESTAQDMGIPTPAIQTVSELPTPSATEQTPSELPTPDTPDATPLQSPTEGERTPTSPLFPQRTGSLKSIEKDAKAKGLEELTLVYPPSLDLTPEQVRAEFVASLLRTRDKSRKEAIIASAMFPLAAAIDTSIIITFGGLMEVSGVWAYTSIRGAVTSQKMTQGLALGEAQCPKKQGDLEGECTCGKHDQEPGSPETVSKGKGKKKKGAINLRVQQSNQLEILKRYLALICLKKDYNMFPQFEEAAGDVNEGSVLEAIGWQPTRRQGRDLEVEYKDKTEKMTPEEDEQWQTKEAKDDVRRFFKKGATEWISWCKSFKKNPDGTAKK